MIEVASNLALRLSHEPVGSRLSRSHRESANEADFAESAFRISTALSFLVFTWVYLALLAAAIALGHVIAMCARRVSIPSCANTALI